jgi:hypothetical protein
MSLMNVIPVVAIISAPYGSNQHTVGSKDVYPWTSPATCCVFAIPFIGKRTGPPTSIIVSAFLRAFAFG